MFASLVLDLRFAWRLAVRQPGLSLAAILTLGIGFGSTTALYSVADAWLLTPLPFHQPDRLTMVWETIPSAGIDRNTPAPAALQIWRERSKAYQGFAAWTTATFTLTGFEDPLRIDAARVSGNLLSLLGLQPEAGRDFARDEDRPGGGGTALISSRLSARLFGEPGNGVGQALRLDEGPVRIVGVRPSSVRLTGLDADLWVPFQMDAAEQASWNRYLWVLGRLNPGTTVEAAEREIASLMQEQSSGSIGANVVDLREQTVGTLERDVGILMAATVCVLLIACTNVASLALARVSSRRAELSVRTALGATRRSLARQLIVETLAQGTAGAAIGLLIAAWGVRGVVALLAESARLNAVDVRNGSVLLFALVAAMAASLLCAALPAWQWTGRDIVRTMREESRSATPVRRRVMSAFVVFEVAVALALLVSAGLVLRSYWNIGRVDGRLSPGGAGHVRDLAIRAAS